MTHPPGSLQFWSQSRKDQNGGNGHVSGNSCPFPEIVGIILSLVSVWNYPAHKSITTLYFRSLSYLLRWRTLCLWSVQFSSVHSLSRVQLFATSWITAWQASLSITNSQSSHKLMSIESVMPSSHLILCHPFLLLPPIPPSNSLFQWVNSSHEVAKVLEFQL